MPLRNGRSASRLTSILPQSPEIKLQSKLKFEKRLENTLDSSEDPLEEFLEYIKWSSDAYPQGGTSKKSGLLNIIERCLKYCAKLGSKYTNDSRFLKVWLWYIELFSNSRSESKEIFVFLLRNRIGCELAEFYIEFASLLVSMKCYKSAHEILDLGVKAGAQPVHNLLCQIENLPVSIDHDLNDGNQNLDELVLGKKKKDLIASLSNEKINAKASFIFADDDFQDTEISIINIFCDSKWNKLDSYLRRNKENKPQSVPLISNSEKSHKGIMIPIGSSTIQPVNKKRKIPIFEDLLGKSKPIYRVVDQENGKRETIQCNFGLIYTKQEQELCFEEVLALHKEPIMDLKPEILEAVHTQDLK